MNCAEQMRANNPALDGWVRAYSLERDLLIREHDKRVEEYIELERLLPSSLERIAMDKAIAALADAAELRLSAFLSGYRLRLKAAGY